MAEQRHPQPPSLCGACPARAEGKNGEGSPVSLTDSDRAKILRGAIFFWFKTIADFLIRYFMAFLAKRSARVRWEGGRNRRIFPL